MGRRLKLIEIGEEVGIVLPDDILAHLGLEIGDALSVREVPCGVELERLDGAAEKQI